jgi:phosphonate transport system permease protein
VGVDVRILRLKAFGLSSAIASVAGALFAYYLTNVTSEAFNISFAIQFIAMIIIGGMGSLPGSLVGAAIWLLLPSIIAGLSPQSSEDGGFIGKLLYEALEETDPKQIEAITATGASGAQRIAYGFIPQIMPTFAGISVYRWDINIRESTVLGLVGAGGIGLQLNASVSRLAWPEVTVMFIAILCTVAVSEWVSARVRAAII